MTLIEINRNVRQGTYRIADIFPGIDRIPVLLEIFDSARELAKVMDQTRAIVSDQASYMKVDNTDGSIIINVRHLQHSKAEILYLDIIHELVHVKQHLQGLDLYDRSKAYVDRQTEIDAYILTVKEARRIGFSDREISEYLQVEWITPEEHRRLADRLNVNPTVGSG